MLDVLKLIVKTVVTDVYHHQDMSDTKDISYIKAKLASLLKDGAKLTSYSEHTQSQVDDSTVLLWNERACTITTSDYEEFKEAVKKVSGSSYSVSGILSQVDFCIALVLSVEYSLNHIIVPSVKLKSFTSFWRFIQSLSATGSESLSGWISSRIGRRCAEDYVIMLDADVSVPVSTPAVGGTNMYNSRADAIRKGISSSVKRTKAYSLNDTMLAEGYGLSFDFPESELTSLISLREATLCL